MTIDDDICENCLAKNHCDVLPYSNNCDEVRAMTKHDKQVYNKAIDDFKEELFKNSERARPVGWLGYSEIVTCEKIYEIAEQLKAGGENE